MKTTNLTTNLTAKITGTGPDSTVPDNDGATDAELYDGEKLIGCVTLLPSESSGDLVTWGPGLDCWADDMMRSWLRSADDLTDACEMVAIAVREAASQ